MVTRSLSSLLLPLILMFAACVYNVEEVEVWKHATYTADDWTAFEARLDNGSLTITGIHSSRMTLQALFKALVLNWSDNSDLSEVEFGLQVSSNVLQMTVDYPESLQETMVISELQGEGPRDVDLNLYTSNGSISVTNMIGNVVATTTNGTIRVSTHGAVSLRTSNGEISLVTGKGGTATTSNGPIHASVLNADINTLRLETSNGRISITIPPGVGYTLDLSTTNGSVDLRNLGFSFSGDHFSGPILGGGPLIRARTSNGSIVLDATR